jgi:hypothetical protein
MGKKVLTAIGLVLLGALLVVAYNPKVLLKIAFFRDSLVTPRACAGNDKYCIPVDVSSFDGKPEIQTFWKVQMKEKGKTPIFWEIGTAGYTFAPDSAPPAPKGIDFDTIGNKPGNPPETSVVISGCMRISDTRYKCIFDGTAKGSVGTFAYQINLSDGTNPVSLDPYILNN